MAKYISFTTATFSATRTCKSPRRREGICGLHQQGNFANRGTPGKSYMSRDTSSQSHFLSLQHLLGAEQDGQGKYGVRPRHAAGWFPWKAPGPGRHSKERRNPGRETRQGGEAPRQVTQLNVAILCTPPTLFTGFPSLPVCLVTSIWLSIFSAHTQEQKQRADQL